MPITPILGMRYPVRRAIGKRRIQRCVVCALLAAAAATTLWTRAGDTTTQPAQSDLDFLLSKSTGAASQPVEAASTSQPVSPFKAGQADGERHGMILLSNGEKIYGLMSHTQRKPVRVWVEEQKQYKDIPFALIRSIDAQVIWERQEREWHFKESGSDIKEYSGKEYPARDTQYQIVIKSGKVIAGAVDEPIYVATADGNVTYILHKRDKGELGQPLDELVYVKHVEFDDAAPTTRP